MRRGTLALLVLGVAACSSGPEPIKEPRLAPPDNRELFRRARFRELTSSDPDSMARLARLMRSSNVSASEDFEDFTARGSYRRGEVEAAKEALKHLSASNKTRRIIEALLTHADPKTALRESECARRLVDLPLAARALDRGYAVISIDVNGKPLHVLWDTGATDNVLSPKAADLLELPLAEAQFTLRRKDDALVVRLAASATKEMRIGPWQVRNVPWLVSDLDTVEGLKRDIEEVDGFLSPQLLLPNGCFAIDKNAAILRLGFGEKACRQMMAEASKKTPIFPWDGEIYVSGRVWRSPELALRLETGSPVTFLRTHASRYLPKGLLDATSKAANPQDVEIAHELTHTVSIQVAGREKLVSAIDLDPARQTSSHDDIATLGNDVLLQGRGIVLDFTRMELGTLDFGSANEPGARPR